MPHCNNCGFESAPGTRFCPACGRQLAASGSVPPPFMPQTRQHAKRKRKGMSGIAIALIISGSVIILVLGALAVYYFMFMNRPRPIPVTPEKDTVEVVVEEKWPEVPDVMTGAFISPKGTEWPIKVRIHRSGGVITGATYTNLSQNISFGMDCVQDRDCISFNGNSGKVFTMIYIYSPETGRWEGSAQEGDNKLPAYLVDATGR